MTQPFGRKVDYYPGEEPSRYEVRWDTQHRRPMFYALCVSVGQNILIERVAARRMPWFLEIERFVAGESTYASIKDLYWAAYKALGYGR